MDQDVRPGEGEYIGEIEPITISHGQRIILDLNRHTIDWTQGNATIETLFVVESGSSLTITGDGLICGGRSSTNSLNGSIVAVRSGGSFTLQGGSLSNTLCVCAVSVAHNASFTMTGGEIYHYVGQGGFAVFASGGFTMSGGVIRGKDNHYTGVHLDGNAASLTMTGGTIQKFNSGVLVGNNAFTVSGDPQITENNTNVSLPAGRTITVSGTLADTARIGVTMNATSTIPITSGLSGKGTAANFASDNSAYAIGVDQDSEAVMGPKITVSFEPNGGSGDMADVALAQNSLLTLPECTFNLSGAPVISGNVRGGTIENGVLAGGTPDNVLCYYIAPQVTGELTTGASIGVNRRESGGVGLVVRGDESYTLTAADLTHFTSDDDAYFIRLDGNNGGELFLPTAVLKSYSLTLEGEIGLNFKVQIPPELVNSVHAVIVYNGTETDTPMEATINEYIYKVTKRVPAKEIGNDVGLKIVANGSGKAIQLVDSGNDEYPDNTASFSVTDYCNAVDQVDSIEGVSTEKLQKLKSLVRALQNYGAYAQQYFKKGNAPGFAQNAGDIDSVTVSGYVSVKPKDG